MRFLFRLLLLVLVAIAVVWFLREPVLDRFGRDTRASAREAAGEAGRRAREGLSDLDLSTERIKEELSRTGRVVRRKADQAMRSIEEGTRDTRTTAKIEARYALDPELKAREIDVETRDGRVTLRGRVGTPEDVARAIRMAMEEETVSEVTSDLQVVTGTARGAEAEGRPVR